MREVWAPAMSGQLASALLDSLDDAALDRLAELLAPRIEARLDSPPAAAPDTPLSCGEAAELAGVHVETIRRAARSGKLPCVRAGTAVRIDPAGLDAWLTTGRRPAATPRARPRHRRTGTPLKDALNA